MKSILFIANNNIGNSQSGGDTIFLEFIKNWQTDFSITVFGSQETLNLLERYHLKIKFLKTDNCNRLCQPTVFNLLLHCIRRLITGSFTFLKNINTIKQFDYCYTVSDFIPDFFIGVLYKIIKPNGIWLCGQYLFAPRPGSIDSPYHNQPIKGWLYYLFQIPTQKIANRLADQILITSKPDQSRFPNKKVVIVQGGVDTTFSKPYLKSKKSTKKIFDAVFQGRLHPQKGIIELIDIWKLVIQKIPTAKLAIIGDGQLENELKIKIKKLKLLKNVTLFGFQTGHQKYKIFQQSKIVVHPSIYDSGGMAAAEAMAWGLPGVSFDLEALKTYYPKGMIKSKIGNYQDFANNICLLLQNQKIYRQTANQAIKLINTVWDWQKRSQKLKAIIFNEQN